MGARGRGAGCGSFHLKRAGRSNKARQAGNRVEGRTVCDCHDGSLPVSELLGHSWRSAPRRRRRARLTSPASAHSRAERSAGRARTMSTVRSSRSSRSTRRPEQHRRRLPARPLVERRCAWPLRIDEPRRREHLDRIVGPLLYMLRRHRRERWQLRPSLRSMGVLRPERRRLPDQPVGKR
jgi:hypothetical protein